MKGRTARGALGAAAAALAASCAAGAVKINPNAPAPAARQEAPPAGYSPRSAGVITLLSVDLPEAGTTIGGHYAGVQYDRLRSNIQMSDGARQRWTRATRAAGDSVLVTQGFRIQIPGPPSSDAEPLRGVRFGLAATVHHLELKTIGYVEPYEIEGRARVDWELLDLSSGASVFEGTTSGSIRGADSLDAAMNTVLATALARLTGQPAFQRAIMAPRPLYAQDLLLAEFVHPVPRADDTVALSVAAQNLNAETGILGGIVVLHGSRGFSASAVVLSRDGLALAPADVARQRWVWSRNFEGRTRAARVLRTSGEVALIELSCVEACETVMWEPDTSLADKARVVWVGGQGIMRNASMGMLYSWKSLRVRRDGEGTLSWRTRGRPVPLNGSGVARADGVVVGIATRTGVVPIGQAFEQLKVAVVPSP